MADFDFKINDSREIDNEDMLQLIRQWNSAYSSFKDRVFDGRNKYSRQLFEDGWGAQSIQFVNDCLPEFHRILKSHYHRKDDLTLVDIGAVSGASSNIFAQLYASRQIYSKITVDAIDYTDLRKNWVNLLYPRVNYNVADLFNLPSNNWDFVYCNHVIEHVDDPRKFIEKIIDFSKGFAFVYSPYMEMERIDAHRNTISKELYEGLNVENFNVIKSMGWHADIDDDYCLF